MVRYNSVQIRSLQRRLKGDWKIWKAFCNKLRRDFNGFLGARASEDIQNIGGALTSHDLSIYTKLSL